MSQTGRSSPSSRCVETSGQSVRRALEAVDWKQAFPGAPRSR